MDKILKINFNNSKDDIMLYNWLITHENMQELVKDILIKHMKKDIVIDTVLNEKYREEVEKLKNGSGEYSITVDNIESALRLLLTLCD